MKKPVKIAIITFVVILILFSIIGFTIFKIANKEKKSITSSDFNSVMEQKGYYIGDVTNQFSQYGYFNQASIAVSNDYNYQIEFYELSDDSYATQFFNDNMTIFETSKSESSSYYTINGKNYSKYTLSSDGKYKVISRINNTVMYLNVDSEYKNSVENILNEFGY